MPKLSIRVLMFVIFLIGLMIGFGSFVLASDGDSAIPSTEAVIIEGDLDQNSFAQVAEGENSEGTGPLVLLPPNGDAAVNGGGAIFERRIAGLNFVPRDSDQLHDYASGGCIQGKVAGTGLWSHTLQLPHNSNILELTVYYFDNNVAASGAAWITRFNQQGATEDLVSVSSLDDGGYGSNTAAVNHVVDNANWSYAVYIRPGSDDSSVRACGVRVQYQLDITAINLPVILNMSTGD